ISYFTVLFLNTAITLNISLLIFAVPAPVENVSIQSITTSSISLIWPIPAGNRSSYEIQISGTSPLNLAPDTKNTTVGDLIPGNLYTFTIFTKTGNDSIISDERTLSSYTVPAAVENVTIENITTNSISLRWPTPDGNRSSYEIQVSGDPSGNFTLHSENVTVDGLVPGNLYTFNIFAKTGDELISDITTLSTYTVPAPVENVSIQSITTSSISLIWPIPAGNRSSYEIQVSGASALILNSDTKNATVDGLIPGNLYTLTIFTKAGNDSITSDGTTLSSYTVPAPVENVSIESITTSSISLVWPIPAGNRSSYELQVSGTSPLNLTPNTKNALVGDLIPGNLYTFTIFAKAGNESIISDRRTLSSYTVPARVNNIIAFKENNNSLKVSWSPPEGNKSAYQIDVLGDHPQQFNVTAESVIITNLTSNFQYTVRISAVVGEYDQRRQGSSTDISVLLSDILSATNITITSVNLVWIQPQNLEDISYNITGFGDPSFNWSGSTEEALIENLTPGNLYVIHLSATSNNTVLYGYGEQISLYTIPAPVENVSIESITTSSISLIWPIPAGNRSSYEIQVSGTSPLNLTPDTKNATVGGLIPGNLYTFTIFAKTGNDSIISDKTTLSGYTVPAPVENVSIESITTSSISLIWPIPAGNRSSYEIQVSGTSPLYLTPDTKNATVGGLIPGNLYTFTIFAKTGNDSIISDRTTLSSYTVPAPVENVSIETITTSSISLIWPIPAGNRSSYEIQVSGTSPLNLTPDTKKATVGGLIPGNLYTFTIFTKTGNDSIISNATTVSSYTVPARVNNIIVFKENNNSLKVSWSPPEGNKSAYQIYVLGDHPQQFNVTAESVIITNLTSNFQYTVRISAVVGEYDQRRQGSSTDISVLLSDILSATNITITSVNLVWFQPQNIEDISYNITGFGDPSFNWSGSTEEALIENLTPGNLYVIHLSATANNTVLYGYGEQISLYTIPAPVENVSIQSITTSSISLIWPIPAGNRSSYEIQVSGTSPLMLTPDTKSTTVGGLKPGNLYTFTIFTKAGNDSIISDRTTLSSYTVPASVENVTIENITTNSISLRWPTPDGNRSSYEIQVSGDPSRNFTLHSKNVTVDGLVPGNLYTFNIFAKTGDELISDMTTLSTYAVPATVENITVNNITSSSIYLTWPIPEGNRSSYEIQVSGTPSVNLTVYSESVLVGNLVPGNFYLVTIFAKSGNGLFSSGTDVSAYTEPECVKNFKVTNITLHSVALNWMAATGNITSYFIEVYRNANIYKQFNEESESVLIGDLYAGIQYTFIVCAMAGDNTVKGCRTEISAVTHSSSVTLALVYYATDGQREQNIMAQMNKLVSERFPNQNITAVWKQEKRIL
uniref:Fibronectin type-III domain-containing protein n=1 Tax=Leptobrachium leishanense TaxID=445787 RepID=A0A8C5PIS8_9ANUR